MPRNVAPVRPRVCLPGNWPAGSQPEMMVARALVAPSHRQARETTKSLTGRARGAPLWGKEPQTRRSGSRVTV